MPKKPAPDKILKKAEKILLDRRTKSDRIETCLQAELCPNCGEPCAPKWNNSNKIYRFTCTYCHARYHKETSKDNLWREKLLHPVKPPEK